MTKVVLNDLVNLENQTSAVNTINANNAVIETAFDNTISRDGTSPNQMDASLDMNSNHILNLPIAVLGTEPIRKFEFDTAVFGSIPIPVPINTNNVFVGNNTFTAGLDIKAIRTGIGLTTDNAGIQLGILRTGSGAAFFDMFVDGTSIFRGRLFRDLGDNGGLYLVNRGTGPIIIQPNYVGGPTFLFDYSTGLTNPVDRGSRYLNQTTGAGALTGTLTNAPVAGNPSFWRKENINGINYVIPCWLG